MVVIIHWRVYSYKSLLDFGIFYFFLAFFLYLWEYVICKVTVLISLLRCLVSDWRTIVFASNTILISRENNTSFFFLLSSFLPGNTSDGETTSTMSRIGPEASGSEGGSALKEGPSHLDVEQYALAESHLQNITVQSISWRGVSVTVTDRETKEPKVIVDSVDGYVEAGQSSPAHHPPSST